MIFCILLNFKIQEHLKCYQCTPGKYSTIPSPNNVDESVCINCEAGKYSSSNSSTACTGCGAGTYLTQTAQVKKERKKVI